MVSSKRSTDLLSHAVKINSNTSKNKGNRREAILVNEWYVLIKIHCRHVHLHQSTYLQTCTVITEGFSATDSY